MLAIELAVEKLYKIMDKQKLGEIDRCKRTDGLIIFNTKFAP